MGAPTTAEPRQLLRRLLEPPTNLFSCPVCGQVLRAPVTLECGHTFCSPCLTPTCSVCGCQALTKPSTNVLIQDLVEKWRRSNKLRIDASETDHYDLQSRYHLRSGHAGLQFHNEIIKHPNLKSKHRRKTNLNRVLRELSRIKTSRNILNFFKALSEDLLALKEESIRSSWNCIEPSDLECVLCSRCILDPVTTGCGHTFCRGCLTRVLDHGLSCPLCKGQLSVFDYSRGPTLALCKAIELLQPKDYKERITNYLIENLIPDKNSDVPVFICTTAFPSVACPLYVYEPRYRLMARRCIQSPSKIFAMSAKQGNGERFYSFGTMLEIKDAVALEDGRFILTTVGIRRFKVLSRGEKDGYDTAKVVYIKDCKVPEDKKPELVHLQQKVHSKAMKWIKSFAPKVLSEVVRLIGHMPELEENWLELPDGPSWAWWLMPLLPLNSQLQVGFLSTTNLDKRLRAIDKMLDHMKIKMKALGRDTMSCSQPLDNSESCESFTMPID